MLSSCPYQAPSALPLGAITSIRRCLWCLQVLKWVCILWTLQWVVVVLQSGQRAGDVVLPIGNCTVLCGYCDRLNYCSHFWTRLWYSHISTSLPWPLEGENILPYPFIFALTTWLALVNDMLVDKIWIEVLNVLVPLVLFLCIHYRRDHLLCIAWSPAWVTRRTATSDDLWGLPANL